MAAVGVRNSAWQGILTPREAEVLELIARGYTDSMIAAEQGYSIGTIKFHTHNIYAKLGAWARGVGHRGRHGRQDRSPRVLAARWWWEHVEHPELAGD
jgi:DNA-binding NarL/FixJ family response regulator